LVIGTGIDLVEMNRIRKAMEKWGGRFLSRIYTSREISYCRGKRLEYVHLAARFAAKEAVRKALGEQMRWRDVEIINGRSGKPRVNLRGKAREIGRKQGEKRIFLSLSHDHSYAIAQAVVTTSNETTE